jgi:hypothetical protein
VLGQVPEREAGHVEGTALHIRAFRPSQAPDIGDLDTEIISVRELMPLLFSFKQEYSDRRSDVYFRH